MEIEEEGKKTLKEIAERIKPGNMGVIVRTAAQGKDQEDFIQDMDFYADCGRFR